MSTSGEAKAQLATIMEHFIRSEAMTVGRLEVSKNAVRPVRFVLGDVEHHAPLGGLDRDWGKRTRCVLGLARKGTIVQRGATMSANSVAVVRTITVRLDRASRSKHLLVILQKKKKIMVATMGREIPAS
jgi:hypothetical protein